MTGLLRTSEVAKKIGVSKRALNEWIKAGLVRVPTRRSRRQGSSAMWSDEDVHRARAVAALRLGWVALPSAHRRHVSEASRALRDVAPGKLLAIGPPGKTAMLPRSATLGAVLRRLGGGPVLVAPATV